MALNRCTKYLALVFHAVLICFIFSQKIGLADKPQSTVTIEKTGDRSIRKTVTIILKGNLNADEKLTSEKPSDSKSSNLINGDIKDSGKSNYAKNLSPWTKRIGDVLSGPNFHRPTLKNLADTGIIASLAECKNSSNMEFAAWSIFPGLYILPGNFGAFGLIYSVHNISSITVKECSYEIVFVLGSRKMTTDNDIFFWKAFSITFTIIASILVSAIVFLIRYQSHILPVNATPTTGLMTYADIYPQEVSEVVTFTTNSQVDFLQAKKTGYTPQSTPVKPRVAQAAVAVSSAVASPSKAAGFRNHIPVTKMIDNPAGNVGEGILEESFPDTTAAPIIAQLDDGIDTGGANFSGNSPWQRQQQRQVSNQGGSNVVSPSPWKEVKTPPKSRATTPMPKLSSDAHNTNKKSNLYIDTSAVVVPGATGAGVGAGGDVGGNGVAVAPATPVDRATAPGLVSSGRVTATARTAATAGPAGSGGLVSQQQAQQQAGAASQYSTPPRTPGTLPRGRGSPAPSRDAPSPSTLPPTSTVTPPPRQQQQQQQQQPVASSSSSGGLYSGSTRSKSPGPGPTGPTGPAGPGRSASSSHIGAAGAAVGTTPTRGTAPPRMAMAAVAAASTATPPRTPLRTQSSSASSSRPFKESSDRLQGVQQQLREEKEEEQDEEDEYQQQQHQRQQQKKSKSSSSPMKAIRAVGRFMGFASPKGAGQGPTGGAGIASRSMMSKK